MDPEQLAAANLRSLLPFLLLAATLHRLAATLQVDLSPLPIQQRQANGNGKTQVGLPSLDDEQPKAGGKKRIVVLGTGEGRAPGAFLELRHGLV